MEDLTGEIVGIRELTPVVRLVQIKVDVPLEFLPGQYVFVVIPGEKPLLRAYSIASSPLDEFVELCVTKVEGGKASNYLHSLQIGDPITIRGPIGRFVLRESKNSDLFVATGSGIAPLRSMIRFAIAKGCEKEMHLLFGVRTKADILFKEEWEELAKIYGQFHPLITFSREEGPEKGYVQTKLDKFHHLKSANVYICGLGKIVLEVKSILERNGFKNIYFERYD